MSAADYRQCTRCVMDSSDPEIAFDELGRCNHCRAYERRMAGRSAAPNAADLDALLERVRRAGRGRPYDCVVGVSGGGDSSFVAYRLAKLGLRVLAVHMDNGWNTALAVRNIKNIVDKLGLDYVSVVLDWDEFRDLQLAFLKASVPEIETPTDIAIPAALHQVAAEHGVKHIASGGNSRTEGILPRAWHYDPKDVRYLKAIHRRFGTRKLLTFPTFGYRLESYYKFVKGIRTVYPLEHLPVEDHGRLLRKELDWRPTGGKHHESAITRFVQSYVLPTKFGFDYRRATFSSMICAGQLSREQALADLRQPPFEAAQADADKRYIATKFGISADELDAIIALPPKSHADYPNDERFLSGLYKTYRLFSEWRARLDVHTASR